MQLVNVEWLGLGLQPLPSLTGSGSIRNGEYLRCGSIFSSYLENGGETVSRGFEIAEYHGDIAWIAASQH